MCFHYSIKKAKKQIEKRFNAEFEEFTLFEPTDHANAFAHPFMPIITNDKPDSIQLFKWGLIPNWVKDKERAKEISKMTLNARVETVEEKPSFKDAIKSQRCLVIADGFYEWKKVGKKKTKYFIKHAEKPLFAFAGIWNSWADKQTGEIISTYSILTQEANPFMAEIHNIKKRQPIILQSEKEWINFSEVKKNESSCFNNKFFAKEIII
jgi:putative SOS response-associated peptidase YedK